MQASSSKEVWWYNLSCFHVTLRKSWRRKTKLYKKYGALAPLNDAVNILLCKHQHYTVQQIFSLKKTQEQTDVLQGNLRALSPNLNLLFNVDIRIF